MRRVCLLILSFFLLSQCNPISDKELRFYWNSYLSLEWGVHEIEKSNQRSIMLLERLINDWNNYIKNYNDHYNSSLLLESERHELKIEEVSNQLEAIKRNIVPQYNKFNFDLGDEVQLNQQNQKLLQNCRDKSEHIFSDISIDSVSNFKWKTDYTEILKHPIKRVFVLMAIENMKFELRDHQKKILDHYLNIAKLPPFEFHYRIDMESKEVQLGDTLKAFIYPLIYNKLKKAVIYDHRVSIDSKGIGHFTSNKSSIKVAQNGWVTSTYNGIFTFKLGQYDTIIFGHPRTYLRNPK